MPGGLVELPSGGGELPHLYMLRAADHGKPLVNAVLTFVPPHAYEIERLSRETPIPEKLLDLIEQVPTSYLVIHNSYIEPMKRNVYETFLTNGITSGRLRFVNRFDGSNDLYAVVKNEPGAQSEAPLPFKPELGEWSAALRSSPENLLGLYLNWSKALYRVELVGTGRLPRYSEFLSNAVKLGDGLYAGREDQFQLRLVEYGESLIKQRYEHLSDEAYLKQLLANAGLPENEDSRNYLADLVAGKQTRAGVLLKIATDRRLVEKERSRSVVLFHYFGYFQRNPDDPPDGNMAGFYYWVKEVENHGGTGEDLGRSFAASGEYLRRKEGRAN
jgi:hypothetical protein